MSLEGKIAVVTGASSGIGRAAALRLAQEGASLVAVGRDAPALMEIVAGVAEAGVQGLAVVTDVRDPDAPDRIVQGAVEAFGAIDVLVNAAGVLIAGDVAATPDESWDEMFDINVRAPFRLLRASIPHLVASGGAVINVSSVTGLRAFPGIVAYCASKAAVDHLTRCAALELAPKRVRVNAVNPGVVITNLHRRGGMGEAEYAAFLERAQTTHPLGRPGQVEEIADLIVFLASERSGWITGETIAVDGGRHLTCAR